MDKRPFSQSCENNKRPILLQLKQYFSDRQRVLEIGSGTGQHAVYFASELPHLTWQCSDVEANHEGILEWIEAYPSDNLRKPLLLHIGLTSWPNGPFDAVFSANTTHIMQPDEAKQMMRLVAEHLPNGGVFCQYGPFNIDGEYTSESNREFDQSLQQRGFGGLRDIQQLKSWVSDLSLTLDKVIQLPANNLMLVWKKKAI